MSNDKQASLRLPTELFDRASALTTEVREDPSYRYVPVVGTSFVLRLAIEAGLTVLEQRYREPGPLFDPRRKR